MNTKNNKPPNQGWNNVVDIINNDSVNNINHSISMKSIKSSRAQSQLSTLLREITIHCGNKYTTNNYNQTTALKEKIKFLFRHFMYQKR